MKIKEIINKINAGLTFRTFNEFGELKEEYFKDKEIYTRGTFHFKSMPTFKNFDINELKKELLK